MGGKRIVLGAGAGLLAAAAGFFAAAGHPRGSSRRADSSASRESVSDLRPDPAQVRFGGAIVAREDCRQCHRIGGEGGRRGPELSGLARRHDRSWIVAHFRDPKRLVPGSKMPAFGHLPDDELRAMAEYLLDLP